MWTHGERSLGVDADAADEAGREVVHEAVDEPAEETEQAIYSSGRTMIPMKPPAIAIPIAP